MIAFNFIGFVNIVSMVALMYYFVKTIIYRHHTDCYKRKLRVWSKCVVLLSIIGVLVELYFKL